MANKVDSNLTGLRYAEEMSLGTLPGSPVWYPLEPNSYDDFGGEISTVARNPINPSRQRKKGVTTDLDATGGFNQDLTFSNTTRLLQGFFFADAREKFNSLPLNGSQVVFTDVDTADDAYTAASGLPTDLIAGDLVLAEGFAEAGNNGIKTLDTASTATDIEVAEDLVNETPTAAGTLRHIGHEFASSDLDIAVVSGNAQIQSAANVLDQLGLSVGEWIFIGGDGAGEAFAGDNGFARISDIATDGSTMTFDKTSFAPFSETGTGLTVRIFHGDMIRNEDDPANIVRRSYNVERTLGEDISGTMSEYLVGAVPNELTINVNQADKVTIDLSFVATDNEQRDGATGVKSGTRPTLSPESAYNTSSDFYRIKLASVATDDSDITPLFAFATQFSLSINNNVTPNKAVGVLGAFDVSAGTFEVGGELTVYFADVAAVQAVRNNADITMDFVMTKDNQGLLFDVPLVALGGGRLSVEQDQAITLPLEQQAAESAFGWTLTMQSFAYLPDLAM